MQLSNQILTFITRQRPVQQKQAGFGLGSMLAALAIATLLHQAFSHLLAQHRATPQVIETAAHLENIGTAAAHYIRDNHATLTATLPLNGASSTITQSMLRDSGYLSPKLSLANPYGQTATVRIRHVTQGTAPNSRNVLEPLVVTQGGRAIPDHELLRIAGKVKAGGTIRSNTPDIAIGNSGGWEAPLSSFGGTPGAGHLAIGMFVSDAGMVEDYLYRNSVPGRPEVNRMNTAIDMAGSNIDGAGTVETDRIRVTAANGQSMWVHHDSGKLQWIHDDLATELASLDNQGNFKTKNRLTAGEYLELEGAAVEGSGCPKNGLVSRNSAGLILSCQSGTWRKQAGSSGLYYGGYFSTDPSGVCQSRNALTGGCSCPSGYSAYYSWSGISGTTPFYGCRRP